MKCTVILDNTREEEIIIYAHQKNELIDEIERMVMGATQQITGFLNEEIIKLDTNDVFCFIIENAKLYAVCESKKYLVKTRLYNIEEMLDKNFVKINQSCIANISKIKKFDSSISGTLKVIFKNGYTDYVSRRNIKNIKERLGI